MIVLDIITKETLMSPPDIREGRNIGGYNLTEYFLRVHGKNMGRRHGRWSRENVEKYLIDLFAQESRERERKEAESAALKAHLSAAIARSQQIAHISARSRRIAV